MGFELESLTKGDSLEIRAVEDEHGKGIPGLVIAALHMVSGNTVVVAGAAPAAFEMADAQRQRLRLGLCDLVATVPRAESGIAVRRAQEAITTVQAANAATIAPEAPPTEAGPR